MASLFWTLPSSSSAGASLAEADRDLSAAQDRPQPAQVQPLFPHDGRGRIGQGQATHVVPRVASMLQAVTTAQNSV